MDIKQLISHKQALLKAAQDKVFELQQQIAMLEAMASEDAVDTALANKIKPVEKAITSNVSVGFSRVKRSPETWPFPLPGIAPAKAKATATGRNPKGSVHTAILSILKDGEERDLDYLEEKQRSLLPVPITRAALRTALMMLKNDGEVTSRKQGYFQLAKK
jgi:hypothetical protein